MELSVQRGFHEDDHFGFHGLSNIKINRSDTRSAACAVDPLHNGAYPILAAIRRPNSRNEIAKDEAIRVKQPRWRGALSDGAAWRRAYRRGARSDDRAPPMHEVQ